MLDIGWPELMLVAVITVLVVGPKELPRVLRTVTYWVRKAQGLAREFQTGMNDLARQTDLEEIKKDMKQITEDTTGPLNVKEFDEMLDPDNSVAGMFTGKAIRNPATGKLDEKKEEADEESVGRAKAAERAKAAAEVFHDDPDDDPNADTEGEDSEELKRYTQNRAATALAEEVQEKEASVPTEEKSEEAVKPVPRLIPTDDVSIDTEPLPSGSGPASAKPAPTEPKPEPEREPQERQAGA